jgi:hypothetical protein
MLFKDHVIEFYKNFEKPDGLPKNVVIHNPFEDAARREAIEAFYEKFFADTQVRVHILGINPSKLTSTSTGVNYTDGFALASYCGIDNQFSKSRELTSDFFYRVVQAMGGAGQFYERIFAWAMMPLSITNNGNYTNYYDLIENIGVEEIVRKNISWISKLPSTGKAVILGSGENMKYFQSLEGSPFGYNEVIYLPHPRWILQYNRKNIDKYLKMYIDALS